VGADPVGAPPENLGHHREHERRRILDALEAHNWNRARAAQELGMPRRTFYRRLREYSILIGADA
jgi:transcriptional regulator of acetoin/glycerol metabolism